MNQYTVEKFIGSGNYGEVNLVRDKTSGAFFVCKKINLANKTPKQQREAENEVKAMCSLNHPNIIAFKDAFVEANTMNIVMEYADAMDLEQMLQGYIQRREFMPENKVMGIFIQVALGLRQLHKQHLLHRDLKSANVFLTSDGGVKMGDFGFAKQLNYTMAVAKTICGTPYYFSPELCQRQPYNLKSDVWSLGVVLYEMINLQKPFEARNLVELTKKVVTESPTPFSATHITPDLKNLCMMLLTKSSDERPSVNAILHLPYVRKYLAGFSEQLQQRKVLHAEKAAKIAKEYPRAPGEPAWQPNMAEKESVVPSKFGKFDRNAVAKLLKGDAEADVALQKNEVSEKNHVETIYHRELPDARKLVSNACPLEVVSELTKAMIAEKNYQTLQNDVTEVLEFEDIIEVIGIAESDEEQKLRDELGDAKFVRAIELALYLGGANNDESEKALAQLVSLLGPKDYLIQDVQRVAAFFEINPNA